MLERCSSLISARLTTTASHLPILSSRFDSLDTNSDGFIDAKELEASRKRRGRGGKKDETGPGPAAKTKKPAAKTKKPAAKTKKKDPGKKGATP